MNDEQNDEQLDPSERRKLSASEVSEGALTKSERKLIGDDDHLIFDDETVKSLQKGMSSKLTDKMKLFVIKYVENNLNAYQACLDAGYTAGSAKVNASVLLHNPLITLEISKIQNQQLKKLVTSKMGQLMKIEKFITIAEAKRDINGAAKMIDIQCKMLGFYAPTEINTTGEIKISFGQEPVALVGKTMNDGVEDFTTSSVVSMLNELKCLKSREMGLY